MLKSVLEDKVTLPPNGSTNFADALVTYEAFKIALILASCAGKVKCLNMHNLRRLMTHMGIKEQQEKPKPPVQEIEKDIKKL